MDDSNVEVSPAEEGQWFEFRATEQLVPSLCILGAELEEILGARRAEYTERERYKFMLLSVAHFLKNIDAPRQIANEFISLVRALGDLDNGKVNPALKENTEVKGPPDTSADWLGRADISLGVVAARAAGKRSREAAAKYVAQRIGPAGEKVRRPDRRGAPLWKSVLNWYDTFSKKGAPAEFQEIFDHNKDFIEGRITIRPEDERLAAVNKWLLGVREKILLN